VSGVARPNAPICGANLGDDARLSAELKKWNVGEAHVMFDPYRMIVGFTDSDRLLYHYTEMSTAKERIFLNQSLKIGRFTCTNDPKESKDWEFSLSANTAEGLEPHMTSDLPQRFSKALKSRAKVACFCKDRGPLSGDHTRDFCLRGLGKARMWAQYANGHSGVCLVFDKNRLHQQVISQLPGGARVYNGSVFYRDRYFVPSLDEGDYFINVDQLRAIGFDRYVEMHVRSFGRRLFFEKSLDWRDENEFRWIVFSDAEEDLFIQYTDSLVGVIFGDRANLGEIDDILRMLPLTVDVIGLKWKNCSPWYDFGALRYARDFRKLNGLHIRE
jgi:hypothetical protein